MSGRNRVALVSALSLGVGFAAIACSAGSTPPTGRPGQQQGAGGQGSAGRGPGQAGGFQLPLDAGLTDAGDTPTEQNNCGYAPFVLDQNPAPVLLVQDRSTSMRGVPGGGTTTRWQNVSVAVQQVVTTTQANVAWGLKFFPNSQTCQISMGPEIAPMLANAAPIVSALSAITGDKEGTGLTSGTPTRKVLEDAITYLKGLKSGTKYIVLATDGQPTCLDDDPDTDDYPNALAAGHAVAVAGIKMAVVGIAFKPVEAGDTPDPKLQFLNDMADIGGMPRNDPADPATHYYPASSTEQLVSAFATISGQVVSCSFKLPHVPEAPENVLVKINDMKIAPDVSNGWEYAPDMLSVNLHGSACDSVKNSQGAVDVKIIMGCPGEPPPM